MLALVNMHFFFFNKKILPLHSSSHRLGNVAKIPVLDLPQTASYSLKQVQISRASILYHPATYITKIIRMICHFLRKTIKQTMCRSENYPEELKSRTSFFYFNFRFYTSNTNFKLSQFLFVNLVFSNISKFYICLLRTPVHTLCYQYAPL